MHLLFLPAAIPTFDSIGVAEVLAVSGVFAVCFVISAAATRWWLNRRAHSEHRRVVVEVATEPKTTPRRREKSAPYAVVTEQHAAADAQRRGLADVLVSTSKSRQRECPTCHRSFPDSVVICPHDASRLSLRSDARHRVKVLDGIRKPTCAACGRRYEHGARYCRFDGQRLNLDGSDRLSVVWVCRTCGDERLEDGHECEPGCEVVKVDPSDARVIPPMIPMMICDACHRVCGPEHTACPDDGEPLSPMHNVRVDALAPLGVGPRRKVCGACGKRYSGAARHCAFDGEKVRPLN